MHPTPPPSTIAVLGLGPMGTAITRSLAGAGHRVQVWNRTPRALADLGLGELGEVAMSSSPSDAVRGSDSIVICVRDHDASATLVEQIAGAVGDAVVVNVSTGTPAEAVDSAERAASLGVRYVTGAVMVPTPLVGTDQCFALYAGAPDHVEDASPVFAALGGTSDVVGDDHAEPPALDLAMLDIYFAGMYAHLHATALAEAHGIDPARFLPYAEGITDTLRATLPGLSSSVQHRTYDGGEARLDMCLSFLESIAATSVEAGIEPGIAGLVRDASARAMTRRPGSSDWDVVAEDLLVTGTAPSGS